MFVYGKNRDPRDTGLDNSTIKRANVFNDLRIWNSISWFDVKLHVAGQAAVTVLGEEPEGQKAILVIRKAGLSP